LEPAFGALVESAELAAFSVAFNLDFAAVWALELCGFAAGRDGFSAACACDQRQFFAHNINLLASITQGFLISYMLKKPFLFS